MTELEEIFGGIDHEIVNIIDKIFYTEIITLNGMYGYNSGVNSRDLDYLTDRIGSKVLLVPHNSKQHNIFYVMNKNYDILKEDKE